MLAHEQAQWKTRAGVIPHFKGPTSNYRSIPPGKELPYTECRSMRLSAKATHAR